MELPLDRIEEGLEPMPFGGVDHSDKGDAALQA